MPLPALPALSVIFGGLITSLLAAAKEYLPTLIGKVLVAFGFAVVTNEIVVPNLIAYVQSHMSGMPRLVFAYVGALGIDKVVTMILSALAANKVGELALKIK
ncbi:hypothetical protein CO615_09765 [Lysobacteraceae bacterium NML75-0749]|nr:hypothetical protein CO615_09765 [Xanthomonadaceae bacterium NML75-0749]